MKAPIQEQSEMDVMSLRVMAEVLRNMDKERESLDIAPEFLERVADKLEMYSLVCDELASTMVNLYDLGVFTREASLMYTSALSAYNQLFNH